MRIVGRATQGVTLIKLDKKDSIAAVAKVVADEDEDLDDNDTIIDDASVIDTEEDATENKQSDNEDVE
jgi:DNA gyrase subunit A